MGKHSMTPRYQKSSKQTPKPASRSKKTPSKFSSSKPQRHPKNSSSKHQPQSKTKQIQKPAKGTPLFSIINQNELEEEEDQFKALGREDEDGDQLEYDDVEQQDDDENDQIEEEEQEEQGEQQEQQQNDNQGEEVDIDNQQFDNLKEEEEDQLQKKEEEEEEDNGPVDISVLSLQIQQTVSILNNVAKLGQGLPRKHYLTQLETLLHQYYGYNHELITHFLGWLNPAELVQLMEANEVQRPLTIRSNSLKTRRKELAQSLIQRGVNLDPLAEWSNVGIKIYSSKVPIGATPQYLAGHYMLQSASSLLPVMALNPQPHERILDLASAPGGKTTHIAQLMKNTGCIFANDLKKERLKALQFNLYRMGVQNVCVSCRDGRKYAEIFPGGFDRVLLDAPCTGLGIIAKDPSIKANRLLIDIYKNSHMQKQLILAAIDCCKVNGVIVYSTCSISPLQNQQVVNYALKRRYVKVVECQIEVGEQGLTKFMQKRFHQDLKKTRRIYPHVHNMDGFYVAKLVKVSKGKKQQEHPQVSPELDAEE